MHLKILMRLLCFSSNKNLNLQYLRSVPKAGWTLLHCINIKKKRQHPFKILCTLYTHNKYKYPEKQKCINIVELWNYKDAKVSTKYKIMVSVFVYHVFGVFMEWLEIHRKRVWSSYLVAFLDACIIILYYSQTHFYLIIFNLIFLLYRTYSVVFIVWLEKKIVLRRILYKTM